MKVKPETTLFKVLTGSRLYGTNSPDSDYDYKAVCLPSLTDLLLNHKLANRKVRPEGLKAGDKMLLGEDETEYLPLQVFFDDFFSGQTYALEVAFAAADGKTVFENDNEDTKALKSFCTYMMQDLVRNFTTSNVKKMVGYAVAQSKLYGLKTERFTALKEVVDMIKNQFDKNPNGLLGDDKEFLEKLLKVKFVKLTDIHSSSATSGKVPALEVTSKQYLMANKLETVYNSLNAALETYGSRVKEFDGEGVDWKALSHAVRITEQVLELCHTSKLEFPSKNAEYLRKMKNGELTLEESTTYLETQFKKIDSAIEASTLPERTHELEEKFNDWKLQMLYVLYNDDFENVVKLNKLTF